MSPQMSWAIALSRRFCSIGRLPGPPGRRGVEVGDFHFVPWSLQGSG